MKKHPNESHVSPPRRRLFGAVVGVVAGIVGWKVGSRKDAPASPAISRAVGSKEPAASSNPIVVQPAPHSVKRHG